MEAFLQAVVLLELGAAHMEWESSCSPFRENKSPTKTKASSLGKEALTKSQGQKELFKVKFKHIHCLSSCNSSCISQTHLTITDRELCISYWDEQTHMCMHTHELKIMEHFYCMYAFCIILPYSPKLT